MVSPETCGGRCISATQTELLIPSINGRAQRRFRLDAISRFLLPAAPISASRQAGAGQRDSTRMLAFEAVNRSRSYGQLHMPPGLNRGWQGATCSLAVPTTFAMLLFAGCASTGTPRPPSLRLPQPVRDLDAERVGNRVELRFTVPTLATDRQPLAGKHGAGALTAEFCRFDRPGGPCTPLPPVSVTAGQLAQAHDDLPPALQSGPVIPLRYTVRVLNGRGHAAGESRDAFSAAGSAPAAIERLAEITTARGVQLTWQPAAHRPAVHIQIEAQNGDRKRTLTVPDDPGGAVDAAPKPGDTVTYTVVRAEEVAGPHPVTLRGEPATVTATRAPDTFAPVAPTGLAAVAVQMNSVPPEVDLSWEPNTETDLAGYLVQRADVADGAVVLLTPVPIPTAAYRDLAVIPGHTYRYTVRAQDTNGNRSPASAPATEPVRQ